MVTSEHRHNMRLLQALVVIGAAMFLASLAVGFWSFKAWWAGYLTAMFLCYGLPLGAMVILATHHLTGGRWGWAIRRPLESLTLLVPTLLAMLVVLWFGIGELYPWSTVPRSESVPWLAAKGPYLSVWFFIVRMVFYGVVWSAVSIALVRSTRKQDAQQTQPSGRLQGLAAATLVVWLFTGSLACVDWFASLQPVWYSSVFGMYIMVGQVLTAMASIVLLACILTWRYGEDAGLSGQMLADLGSLLLMFVIIHAYLAYCQYFITWNGNTQATVSWYAPRVRGGWGWLVIIIMLVHFALPIALLLSRSVKRHARTLTAVCVVILTARVLESLWMVLPSIDAPTTAGVAAALLLIIAMVCMGCGLFAAIWQQQLRKDATT